MMMLATNIVNPHLKPSNMTFSQYHTVWCHHSILNFWNIIGEDTIVFSKQVQEKCMPDPPQVPPPYPHLWSECLQRAFYQEEARFTLLSFILILKFRIDRSVFFVALLFFKMSIIRKLYLNFQPSLVVPYHSYMFQKWILYVLLFPCQPINGNLIDLIAFVILVCYFLKFSLSFATRNSQLQGMTATPPALLLFPHFCVSMTPFRLSACYS